jgi:membrane protease YdiL (CAAX protease family)
MPHLRTRIDDKEPIMPTSRSATATVSLFIAITLVISAAVVYVLGHLLDNPDAAILTVLVPTTVAVVMTAREAGWSGVRKFLRLRGSAPVSVRLVVTAALTIPVLALTAIALGSAVTGESYDIGMPAEGLVILLPLLIVVIGEEYGWRGFALPRLQVRYSALVTSLIVGVAWWMWHYPPSLIETGVPLDTPFWLFGIFVVSMAVVMTSIFNASGGSVGLTTLFHLASNAAFVFLPLLPENRGGELTTFSIFVALAVVLAAMVVRINGPESLASGRPHQVRDRRPIALAVNTRPLFERPSSLPAGSVRLARESSGRLLVSPTWWLQRRSIPIKESTKENPEANHV